MITNREVRNHGLDYLSNMLGIYDARDRINQYIVHKVSTKLEVCDMREICRISLTSWKWAQQNVNSKFVFRWADNSEAKGSDGVLRKFDHPFLQVIYFPWLRFKICRFTSCTCCLNCEKMTLFHRLLECSLASSRACWSSTQCDATAWRETDQWTLGTKISIPLCFCQQHCVIWLQRPPCTLGSTWRTRQAFKCSGVRSHKTTFTSNGRSGVSFFPVRSQFYLHNLHFRSCDYIHCHFFRHISAKKDSEVHVAGNICCCLRSCPRWCVGRCVWRKQSNRQKLNHLR